MKLTWKQIDGFIRKPDPKARIVLIYGPDTGLVKERATLIGKSVVADLSDPFNVTVLTSEQVVEDPARLNDEARAMSMMGGARLIRVEDASDKITPVLKDYLKEPSAENLIVLEAGELGPRSPLRILAEKADNAAALPCYVEGERDIAALIRTETGNAGYNMQSDALAWMASAITGDRMQARSEIEKLITYMGTASKTISLEDAQANCGTSGDQSLDDLVYGATGGQAGKALHAYARLIADGTPVIMIVRALQNHIRRLHFVKSKAATGMSMEEAIRSLQPPVFFKYEPAFRTQASRWSISLLQRAARKLAELEIQTKQTGMPAETLCAQTVVGLSLLEKSA